MIERVRGHRSQEGGHGANVMLILSTLGATESSIRREWGLYSIALEWPLLWLLFSSPEELQRVARVRERMAHQKVTLG